MELHEYNRFSPSIPLIKEKNLGNNNIGDLCNSTNVENKSTERTGGQQEGEGEEEGVHTHWEERIDKTSNQKAEH